MPLPPLPGLAAAVAAPPLLARVAAAGAYGWLGLGACFGSCTNADAPDASNDLQQSLLCSEEAQLRVYFRVCKP